MWRSLRLNTEKQSQLIRPPDVHRQNRSERGGKQNKTHTKTREEKGETRKVCKTKGGFTLPKKCRRTSQELSQRFRSLWTTQQRTKCIPQATLYKCWLRCSWQPWCPPSPVELRCLHADISCPSTRTLLPRRQPRRSSSCCLILTIRHTNPSKVN